MFKVTEDIIYVGVNDHEVDLFVSMMYRTEWHIIRMLFLMRRLQYLIR